MTLPRLYLDLDGVMADFDAHFPALFGVDHRTLTDAEMWAMIDEKPDFFATMPMCEGAARFFEMIHDLKPIILTSCPRTHYQRVAVQKREWVNEYLGDFTVLPIMGGQNKWLFMHKPGDILIDDYEKNCAPWRDAGGIAVLHRSWITTTVMLREALNK